MLAWKVTKEQTKYSCIDFEEISINLLCMMSFSKSGEKEEGMTKRGIFSSRYHCLSEGDLRS
jgi:hypothetical protein